MWPTDDTSMKCVIHDVELSARTKLESIMEGVCLLLKVIKVHEIPEIEYNNGCLFRDDFEDEMQMRVASIMGEISFYAHQTRDSGLRFAKERQEFNDFKVELAGILEELRLKKDYVMSDKIRDMLAKRGYFGANSRKIMAEKIIA